jgi:iron-sulfur cluster repair protein YtfE (RIC family)
VEILAARDRLYAAHGDADLLTECLDLASLLESHMDREESILFPSIRDVLEAGD